MTLTRRVNALTDVGAIADGDKLVGERVDGTTVRITYAAPAGTSDGDKGDITVSSSGTVWRIDTPASVTVATDDKVLIKDTSDSNAFKYVTAQSIADLAAGGVSDGDYGDITVASSNTVWTIDNDVVTYAKMQNVSATDKILGRSTAGAGDVEEITCTAAGRALIDDADASAQRTTLGLGTLATQSGTFSGTSSGTNTGDQTISLTGDVTGSGTGSFAATIANDAVTYAKMQNVSDTDKLLGRSSVGAGDVEEIACTAAGRALLDDADASAQRTTLGLGTLATQSGTFSGTSSGTNTGDQNLFSTIAVSGQSDVVADSTTDTLTLAAGTGVTITTTAGTDTITISASGTGDVVGPASATDNAAARFDSTTGKLIQNSLLIINDTTGNISGFEQATASKNLVVGGNATASGYIDFLEDTDNGSNKITVTAPSAIATDKTITLPDTTGTVALTANKLSDFAATTSSELAGVISDETGSGALVFGTSPTLVTPALGTPSSGTLTNCTGLPVAGGGTGVASTTAYAVLCGGTTSTNPLQSIASVGTSGHVLTSNGAGALPTFQAVSGSGDVVGPASATDNAAARFNTTTGKLIQDSLLIIADTTGNISGFEQATATKNMVVGGNSTAAGYIDFKEDSDNGSNKITLTAPSAIASDKTITFPDTTGTVALTANKLSDFAATTSLELKNTISDETGSGALVFATSPTLVTPVLGTPSSGTLTNCTGLPVAGGGTGIATTTAYSVICAGTTSTGAFQSLASLGSAGAKLTSNGAGALPSFKGGNTAYSVYLGSNQSYTTTQLAKITLNTESFDGGGMYDSSTNYRFTPTIAGKYLISCQATILNVNDGKSFAIYIYKNGASVGSSIMYSAAGAASPGVGLTEMVSMNGTTDYIEIYFYNGDSTTRSVSGVSQDTFSSGVLMEAT